jgi:hypothetical protein
MPSTATKLFNFSRALPEPFDKISSKKVKISSKYGDGTEATLNSTVIKAVHMYLNCVHGTADGALGLIDHRSVAEYKSAAGPDAYHIVVYDSAAGNIIASVYDKNTESFETYTVGNRARDGAAVVFAMLPALMEDEEFSEHMASYKEAMNDGFSDLKSATEDMAFLCDNAYRRVGDDTCAAAVKIKLEASGNLTRISHTQLDSGTYTPKTVLAGEFTIFAQNVAAPVLKPESAVDHGDFVGKYNMNPIRTLNPRETGLVPELESWYILPEQVISVCKHALASTGKQAQMRNFLLRGPAGTGKTEGAKAIAAGMGLPYVKYTCSANTEIYDFIGQVFPETGLQSTGYAVLDSEREELAAMGGVTYTNVAKLLGLPGLDDMDYDPEGVYRALSGLEKPDASSQDCMALVMERITDKVQSLCSIKSDGQDDRQTYTYVETDFVRALKYGWVCEIQEPSTIMQPGVLVGLNSLLEQSGSITLPTGEIIKRHPETVIVVTTNIDYEGCRGMNQSVLDRMNLVLDIELPPAEIMAQRAMSVTGCEDDYMVSQMVQVVNDMSDFCRKNGVTDGSCGMRGLIDWIISTEITNNPYESALHTVISKATANEEDRHSLITSVLEPLFAPKRRTASA